MKYSLRSANTKNTKFWDESSWRRRTETGSIATVTWYLVVSSQDRCSFDASDNYTCLIRRTRGKTKPWKKAFVTLLVTLLARLYHSVDQLADINAWVCYLLRIIAVVF